MAIFTMSDLHLSLDTDKSMEVFGNAWNNYIERIKENWISVVEDEDTVLIGGDISWAMHLKDCIKDFEFLNSLPGKKLLFKGNHDYWWESITKMNNFIEQHGLHSLSFVHNKAAWCEDVLVCGTRGWNLPADGGFGEDDNKIYQREILRLELSLKDGRDLCQREEYTPRDIVCILHYPPFAKDNAADENITSILREYSVTKCFYGHLHASSVHTAFEGVYDGIEYKLVSGDKLGFMPVKI